MKKMVNNRRLIISVALNVHFMPKCTLFSQIIIINYMHLGEIYYFCIELLRFLRNETIIDTNSWLHGFCHTTDDPHIQ